MSNYRKCVDKNQERVVQILRARGFQVKHTHMLGQGFPDLIVSKNKKMGLVEVKDGAKAKLTPPQEKFISSWTGPEIVIIRNDEDALKFEL